MTERVTTVSKSSILSTCRNSTLPLPPRAGKIHIPEFYNVELPKPLNWYKIST